MKIHKNGIAVAALILFTTGLLITRPASAAVIIAETGTGTQPTAFTPTEVSSGDYVGISPSATFGPQDILLQTANTYSSNFDVDVKLNITGAHFSPTSFDGQSSSDVSVAGTNLDGSIGTFSTPAGVLVGTLSTEVLINQISANWNFLDLTGLIYDALGGLATPGAVITLSGEIVDANNQQVVFETLAPTTVVFSSAAVPAPGALALLLCGLLGLSSLRRRSV